MPPGRPKGRKNNTPVEVRFWSFVDKRGPDDCWEWTGAPSPKGYGHFWDGNRLVGAHRFSYQLHNDYIEEELLVCHTCDNPTCVNPKHLFQGTISDNNRDCMTKGRNPNFFVGEHSPDEREAIRRSRITMGPTKRNTSGYKGVSYHKQTGKWKAEIKMPDGKKPSLGCYNAPEEAAKAYDQAALSVYGPDAYTNFK